MDTRLRARRAPFGFPAEGVPGPGKSRLPSKGNAIIEAAIKKIYLTDVAAVIEKVQLQCFKATDRTFAIWPHQKPADPQAMYLSTVCLNLGSRLQPQFASTPSILGAAP
jgi:hypothetical protein